MFDYTECIKIIGPHQFPVEIYNNNGSIIADRSDTVESNGYQLFWYILYCQVVIWVTTFLALCVCNKLFVIYVIFKAGATFVLTESVNSMTGIYISYSKLGLNFTGHNIKECIWDLFPENER